MPLGMPKATPNVSAGPLGSPQEPHLQPAAWKWAKGMKDDWGDAGPSLACGSGGGEGPDPGEQLLLELIAPGGNGGCWDWGPTA